MKPVDHSDRSGVTERVAAEQRAMRTLLGIPVLRTGILVVAGLSAPGGVSSVWAQGTEWQFSAQAAAPVDLPGWLDDAQLRASLSYEEGQEVLGFLADLDLDGTKDYVLRASLDVCGSNCDYVLLDARTRSSLGRVGGSVLFVGPVRINRYPVIRAYGHSSADSGYWSTSVFDGVEYVTVGSVFLEGSSVERLFEDLREVPYWPPPGDRGEPR